MNDFIDEVLRVRDPREDTPRLSPLDVPAIHEKFCEIATIVNAELIALWKVLQVPLSIAKVDYEWTEQNSILRVHHRINVGVTLSHDIPLIVIANCGSTAH